MRAVDAVAFRAEHEVVARRAPRGLLHHLDAGHAVFCEESLFLGDEQGAGIGERDESEVCLAHLRARGMGTWNAGRKTCLERAEQRRSADAAFEQGTAAQAEGPLCYFGGHLILIFWLRR